MKPEVLQSYSVEELNVIKKRLKTSNIINALFVGVMLGISIFGIIKKGGVNFGTLFPLILLYFIFRTNGKIKLINQELASRNNNNNI